MESFKAPTPEVKAPTLKTPEQPAPTPEYSPSVFKQMTEQSSAKVDNNQHRIFESADNRASQSASAADLKPEKANVIFTTGGFDQRVAAAKQKIVNLGVDTKAKIQSLLFGRESNPPTGGQERDEHGYLKMESLKTPAKPMVSEDRGFEPNRMIKRHNLFMGVDRADRPARVEEFKEKLGEQKEGLVAMQTDIVRMIQENPDINIDDLKKAVEPKLEQAMANPEQKQALDKILNEYSKAHQTVQHYREIFPDDRRLFMEIFGFWPTGEIQVKQGPMTLGFRCNSQQDFARAMTFNYGEGKMSPEDAETAAKTVIGQKFGDVPSSITPPDLKDKIILVSEENEQRERQHYEGDTMAHEEQHVTNTLFKDYRPQFYKFEGLEGLNKLAPEAQQEKITNYLRYNREKVDNDKLHDEIIAQYAGIPMNPKDVAPLVTVLARTYRENFYTTQAAKLKQQIESKGANPQMTDECIKQVFEDELIGQTKDAVYSMVVLQDEGFSKSEIISAFETEPVAKWPQVSRRMIDHRRGEGPKTYRKPMSMASNTPDSYQYDPDALTVFTAAHERVQRSVSKIPEGGQPYSMDYSKVPEHLRKFVIPHAAEGPTTHDLAVEGSDMKMPVSFHIEDNNFYITGVQNETGTGGIIWGNFAGDAVKIKHIELAKNFRGTGVGKALAADLENQLQSQGVEKVYSAFAKPGTIDFFLKNGYKIASLKSLTPEQKQQLDIKDGDFDPRVINEAVYNYLKTSTGNEFRKILLVKDISAKSESKPSSSEGAKETVPSVEAKQGIKTGNVDVSKGFDSVDKINKFVGYLRKQGFEPEKYLYSGFSSSAASKVRKTGTHSETGLLFCASYPELTSTSDTNQNPLLTYAGAEGKGAVALYKPEFLEHDIKEGAYVYRLKKGVTPEQAIEAIIRVKVD